MESHKVERLANEFLFAGCDFGQTRECLTDTDGLSRGDAPRDGRLDVRSTEDHFVVKLGFRS